MTNIKDYLLTIKSHQTQDYPLTAAYLELSIESHLF